MRRTRLRIKGHSETAELKEEIQRLVREVVMLRDGDCVLKKYRHCNDPVKQADHLVTRANSATYADTRLIVCLCRSCHGWKHYHEKEYDSLVKTILPKERVTLWERCEADRQAHKTYKPDWNLEIIALNKVLKDMSVM